MKKLMIALTTAGLFSGAGFAAACDYAQDASMDATPMASVGTPAPTVAKSDAAVESSKKAAAKTSKKTATKASAIKPVALVQQN